MKKLLVGLVVASMCVGSVFAQGGKSMELSAGIDVILPGQDINWDSAVGFTAQYVHWMPNGLGLAAVAGYQTWAANEDVFSDAILVQGGAIGAEGYWEGDLTVFPIGASVLYNVAAAPSIGVTFEGGVRYVIASSDVQEHGVLVGINNAGGIVGALDYVEDVEIDNSVIALLGVDLDVALSQSITLFAGAGYQFDLTKEEIKIADESIGMDNELKGVFVRGGIAWNM